MSVPDGSTVIVGGLSSSNVSRAVSKIPILGDIPIIGLMGQSINTTNTHSTFYVFVRPTILRSGRFEDLKFISVAQRRAAEVADDYPETPSHYIQ